MMCNSDFEIKLRIVILNKIFCFYPKTSLYSKRLSVWRDYLVGMCVHHNAIPSYQLRARIHVAEMLRIPRSVIKPVTQVGYYQQFVCWDPHTNLFCQWTTAFFSCRTGI